MNVIEIHMILGNTFKIIAALTLIFAFVAIIEIRKRPAVNYLYFIVTIVLAIILELIALSMIILSICYVEI